MISVERRKTGMEEARAGWFEGVEIGRSDAKQVQGPEGEGKKEGWRRRGGER